MRERCGIMHRLDDDWHLGKHRGRINNSRPLSDIKLKGWRVSDKRKEISRGTFRVLGSHDSADHCDAVQDLPWSTALKKDALQVGPVEAAYANSPCVVASLDNLG